jgi:hypothetical protein
MPLIAILKENNPKISMLRNATWTLSNFCRGKNPQPDWAMVCVLCFLPRIRIFMDVMQISPALPVLAYLIQSLDEEVLVDTCWAVSYLSDGANEKIEAVIQQGICRRLVELLM